MFREDYRKNSEIALSPYLHSCKTQEAIILIVGLFFLVFSEAWMEGFKNVAFCFWNHSCGKTQLSLDISIQNFFHIFFPTHESKVGTFVWEQKLAYWQKLCNINTKTKHTSFICIDNIPKHLAYKCWYVLHMFSSTCNSKSYLICTFTLMVKLKLSFHSLR